MMILRKNNFDTLNPFNLFFVQRQNGYFSEKVLITFFWFLFLFWIGGCAKEKEVALDALAQKEQAEMAFAEDSLPVSPSSGKARSAASPQKAKANRYSVHVLEGHGLLESPNAFTKERLLEYVVYLEYKSEDFSASRRLLLDITSRYGYIADSQAQAGENPRLSGTIKVKAKDLYTVLKELDGLGKLKRERIETIDHTEQMVLQERRLRRERLRQVRRARASSNTARKDWAVRERLLAQSEDKEDAAGHEKWKINDKITWAQIHISVEGPESAPEIQVPVYSSAFVGLINFLLQLSYLAIYLVPLMLLLYGIWHFGLRRLFRKKQ